jgi:hypothetical protein
LGKPTLFLYPKGAIRMSIVQNWSQIPASQYPFLSKLKRTNVRWKKEQIYYEKVNERYYHKDPLHGEIEEYDKRGKHIGVLTPLGEKHPKKGAVKEKTIRNIL